MSVIQTERVDTSMYEDNDGSCYLIDTFQEVIVSRTFDGVDRTPGMRSMRLRDGQAVKRVIDENTVELLSGEILRRV